MIDALISAGANKEVKDCYGMTPLALAVYNLNIEATAVLLALGADAFTTDCLGKTPRGTLLDPQRKIIHPDACKKLVARLEAAENRQLRKKSGLPQTKKEGPKTKKKGLRKR